jgi:hypothetical protein
VKLILYYSIIVRYPVVKPTNENLRTKNFDYRSTSFHSCNFVPMHWVTHWQDRYRRPHVTVALILPGGLPFEKLNASFLPKVGTDGSTLVLKCNWPELLGDVEAMERCWKQVPGFNVSEVVTMRMSVEGQLEEIREHLELSEYQPIFSTSTIKLYTEVESEIVNLLPYTSRSGGIVLQVILKVRTDQVRDTLLSLKGAPINVDPDSSSEDEATVAHDDFYRTIDSTSIVTDSTKPPAKKRPKQVYPKVHGTRGKSKSTPTSINKGKPTGDSVSGYYDHKSLHY